MRQTKRKIAVFTGNRAEYGLQFPILKAIAEHQALEYCLIVSGAHLNEEFGRTISEIEKDGFSISAEVAMEGVGEAPYTTAQAIGSGIVEISRALFDIQPDFLIVYGDRFESFAAAIAATQSGIATAHVEGGDYTDGGALDDSVRHAITKLAHLHFTTNEAAAERVRRMGEEDWRIHNVGYPALDLIKRGDYASPEEVYKRFHLDSGKPILVFTQHSVATEYERAVEQIRPSLAALETAGRRWNCQVIVTYPNNDVGGRGIIEELKRFSARKLPFVQIHESLGRYYYQGILNVAAACVGNSSSGIKETPAFGLPCVNIGSRQNGRLRAENVLDVDYSAEEIVEAIRRCLFDDSFRERARSCRNPYGAGDAGSRIAEVLASVPIDLALIQKKMTY